MTLDDIKLQIASEWEERQLLDFLDISMDELVEILEDKIDEQQDAFREALGQ